MRWGLTKAGLSRALPAEEARSATRTGRGERGLWQRRFWEHAIRDTRDFERHVDDIHWNPVKHGWVARVRDWPYLSCLGQEQVGHVLLQVPMSALKAAPRTGHDKGPGIVGPWRQPLPPGPSAPSLRPAPAA